MNRYPKERVGRRNILTFLGGAGATSLLVSNGDPLAAADLLTCVEAMPTVTEGPYWVDEKLFRSDIRTDPSTGVAREGIPLDLTITVQNLASGTCVPLTGGYVDIWHCDAIGIYSDEAAYNPGGGTGTVVTTGQKFLRGYQVTDDAGSVRFTTIFPGWYSGRTIHIHMRVRTYDGTTMLGNFVSQLFFDETINNTVLATAPYSNRTSSRDTTNARDNIYSGAQNASRMMTTTTKTDTGYASVITVGVSLKTAATSAPAITSGGVANAASGAAGVTPGSWISIYGTNLAATTRVLTSADLVNGLLPTTLGGVGVQINGKAAYPYYLSPTQINVLSPADSGGGSVAVTVTNSVGTSNQAATTLAQLLPGLFVSSSNYLRAVRFADGAIINGTGAAESGYTTAAAAKAGDVLELYGTGFGPTESTLDPGAVFSGAYATTSPVTVSIGGVAAAVSWAGLVGAGLYQINITVPAGLSAGDQKVIATIGGISSQSTALLKIAVS